jgi:hypothetical protein
MFYKTKTINGNSIVIKTSDRHASLMEFKRAHPYVIGESNQNVSYFEISGVTLPADYVFYGNTGNTAGSLTFTSTEVSFLAGGPADGAQGDTDAAAISEQLFNDEVESEFIQESNIATGVVLDPRYHPDLDITVLQKIKVLEADNDFELDGLGETKLITFELDSGLLETVEFDTRKNTIIDLQMLKSYKELNQAVITAGSQTSVSITNIQVIDATGSIFSLTPSEFDRMLYGVLQVYYSEYVGRTVMKNLVFNPTGLNDIEKKQYLNDNTKVSFSVAGTSSVAQKYTGAASASGAK